MRVSPPNERHRNRQVTREVSAGQKVQVYSSADEDDVGRSENERPIEEVIKGVEHDYTQQANVKPERI